MCCFIDFCEKQVNYSEYFCDAITSFKALYIISNVGKTWNSKVQFISAVMLELVASLKVVRGR
jgi:hypothetical protein